MRQVIGIHPHQHSIKIEWNLGKRCNYDCSYCPSSIHDNSSPHTDINTLKSTVDKLLSIGKKLRISFTGGEPTVHPRFEELIEYMRNFDMIEFISVTTNGTRNTSYYRTLPVDQYVFSVHFEYEWQKLLDNILRLYISNEMSTAPKGIIQLMAHQDKIKHVKAFAETLDFYELPYTIRRVRWTQGDHDLFDDMRYDQNDLDWILSKDSTVKPNTKMINDNITTEYHSNDIIKLHLNQYKGYTCFAGLESLMINWDGDVHRATCRVGGSLGNIYNNTFIIPTDPVTCDRNNCTCSADIPITKYKNSI
jgi:MoaA/NifB/PqqE/SkfB family radical SAM enzyme